MTLAQAPIVAESKPAPSSEGISLSRWSRLKRAAAEGQAPPASGRSVPAEQPATVSDRNEHAAQHAPADTHADIAEQADLPPMSSISLAEDFTPFMRAKVPQALKQQALKALFKEPHFNVMDGLDIYIDDYTVFEPISPEVMATLSSWKTIMNPPQQVVTPAGYAVDVESDEGKAVLAARAEAEEANATLLAPAEESTAASGGLRDAAPSGAVSNTVASDATPPAVLVPPDEIAPARAAPHPRYGKRVGDFSAATAAAAPVDDAVTDSELVPSQSAAIKSTDQ